MKIQLTLDPVEDGPEIIYRTINAGPMFSAILDFSEQLRLAQKYSENDADVLHAGPGYFREMLYRVLNNHGVNLEG